VAYEFETKDKKRVSVYAAAADAASAGR